MNDIWIIFCRDCEEERQAEKVDGGYKCNTCRKTWDEEDVAAYNPLIVELYRQQYYGAKTAGMIKESEFEGDYEQMQRERW